MSDVEFLLDENVLGLDRYLEGNVKYRKVGDSNCIPKSATDPEVVKYAKENNLVIVTKDDKIVKQCKLFGINFVTFDDTDIAHKVINYTLS